MKCLLKYLYSHRLPQTHSRPDETQTASREAAGRPQCGFPAQGSRNPGCPRRGFGAARLQTSGVGCRNSRIQAPVGLRRGRIPLGEPTVLCSLRMKVP